MRMTVFDRAQLTATVVSYQDLVEDNPNIHWAGNWQVKKINP